VSSRWHERNRRQRRTPRFSAGRHEPRLDGREPMLLEIRANIKIGFSPHAQAYRVHHSAPTASFHSIDERSVRSGSVSAMPFLAWSVLVKKLKFLLALYGFIPYCDSIDEDEQAIIPTGRWQKHREKNSSLQLCRNPGLLRNQLFSSLDAAFTRKRGCPAGDGLRAEPECARRISGRSRFSLSPRAKTATTRRPAFACQFVVLAGEAAT
jgi:hypothetical protein